MSLVLILYTTKRVSILFPIQHEYYDVDQN